ncbi:MAG: DNA alkylation repair protein [Chloroflexi bacterium]|nr:DNA alkylation repair protein [Chloroflexota bacterium]
MPAIDPARLRRQTADLAEWFGRPERLVTELETLLEYYADRTQRQQRDKAPAAPPLLKTYNAPDPALKRILAELALQSEGDPTAGLALADALWAQPVTEMRLLAARLLGRLPAGEASEVGRRVRAWGAANQEEMLIPALAGEALARLRSEARAEFFALVESWLSAEQPREQRLGLRALRALLEETDFSDLPVIYRLLAPVIQSHPASLRPSLLRLVEALARASAPETAYFLRECLAQGGQASRVARQSLGFFNETRAGALRRALAENRAGE